MVVTATTTPERVLVTGATGFIGSRLVARLVQAGADVHVAVRPSSDRWRLAPIAGRIHAHVLDLRDRQAVARMAGEAAADVVYHLATYRADHRAHDYREAYDTNVFGLLNLLDASASARRVIHFGSSTEYGRTGAAAREDHPLRPTTLHGLSKASAALLCHEYAARTARAIVLLRLFHVYGPWDRPSRFVPTLITAALEGRSVALTPAGLRHDWTYVDDVVDAALAAARAPLDPGEVINVASGREWTNEAMLERVARLTGRDIRVEARPHAPRPWDSEHWVADVERARRLLGWSAAHDLDAGLAKTIESYRAKGGLNRAV